MDGTHQLESCPLDASDSSRQLQVSNHNRDTLGVNSTEERVLKESHQVRLAGALQRLEGIRRPSVDGRRSKVIRNFFHLCDRGQSHRGVGGSGVPLTHIYLSDAMAVAARIRSQHARVGGKVRRCTIQPPARPRAGPRGGRSSRKQAAAAAVAERLYSDAWPTRQYQSTPARQGKRGVRE